MIILSIRSCIEEKFIPVMMKSLYVKNIVHLIQD
jgi:hypothetical protein